MMDTAEHKTCPKCGHKGDNVIFISSSIYHLHQFFEVKIQARCNDCGQGWEVVYQPVRVELYEYGK
jgi:uncharacterized Zn finger protein